MAGRLTKRINEITFLINHGSQPFDFTSNYFKVAIARRSNEGSLIKGISQIGLAPFGYNRYRAVRCLSTSICAQIITRQFQDLFPIIEMKGVSNGPKDL